MNPLVFHLISGDSFFTGCGIILLVVFLCRRHDEKEKTRARSRSVRLILFLCGLIAVALSTTPLPVWTYLLLIVTTVAWLIVLKKSKWQRAASVAMFAAWIVAILMELPWHFMPQTTTSPVKAITVIGDSVSAGMEEREAETWPSLLSKQHSISVQDLSHVGETAGSALKRIDQHGVQHSFVVVEIGGNDMLGSTSFEKFEHDLEALLVNLKSESRQVVMFELPLLPLYYKYGQSQRTLSQRYGVVLIPKRVFLSILAEGDATLDSIHLSQAGHQRMSDVVYSMVR